MGVSISHFRSESSAVLVEMREVWHKGLAHSNGNPGKRQHYLLPVPAVNLHKWPPVPAKLVYLVTVKKVVLCHLRIALITTSPIIWVAAVVPDEEHSNCVVVDESINN